MKKLLFLILLFPFVSYGAENDTFNSFADRLDSWVEGLEGGVVVSVSGKNITIDKGRNYNIPQGMTFVTTRDGEELIHPITGESLGKKQVITFKGITEKIYDKYSEGRAFSKNGAKKGDRVIFKDKDMPFYLRLSFKNLSEAEEAEARFSVLRSGKIEEHDNSTALLSCGRKKEGDSVAECVFSFNDKVVLKSLIGVKGTKITTAKTTTRLSTGNDFIKNSYNERLKDGFYSVATGYFYGTDKNICFAVSERNKVIIYSYENGKLVEKEVISPFYHIVNIEAVDINNNGKDELFISGLTKKREPSSFVYEFDGKNIVLKQSNFPYFFRTYYINGKKELVCQGYVEGAMNGKIYKVYYVDANKQYEAMDPYVRSYGAGVFGFAYGSFGGRIEENTIFFNPQGILNIAGDEGSIFYSKNNFGNTANIIVHTEKLSTGINVGDGGSDGGGYFVYDEQDIAVPIFQRILEAQNGRFLLYSNVPKKRKKSFGVYKEGIIGEYIFTKSKPVPVWEKSVSSGAVVEADVSSDGRYIALITANGWRASNVSSSDIYILDMESN